MQNQQHKIIELEKRINELEEIITIALNKKLLKELKEQIEDIQSGEFLTEEEFVKKHHLKHA